METVREGYTILPDIDRERYTDLSAEGLEGPFVLSSGKVVYYDPQEGKYYDRDSDIYLTYDEYEQHNSPRVVEYEECEKCETCGADLEPEEDSMCNDCSWGGADDLQTYTDSEFERDDFTDRWNRYKREY